MTVRRSITALFALVALLSGTGCGSSDNLNTAIETDDSVYRQGKQLQRQGRNPEALMAFLKVIEKRGEQYSPESHLEAGLIYQQYIKNQVEAIHHFNKFIELRPKSPEAPKVRGLIDGAMLELARTLPGRPLENQSQWLALREQVETLQRENEQLKAENAALRGGVTTPAQVLRTTRATIDNTSSAPTRPATSSPPTPTTTDDSPISVAPMKPQLAPAGSLFVKPLTPPAPAAATRKHVVAPHETLYGISKKYGVTVEAIVAANPLVLPSVNARLPAGTELKIP